MCNNVTGDFEKKSFFGQKGFLVKNAIGNLKKS
jgi:hypothetical protein